mgnify:CR=1 FL=1
MTIQDLIDQFEIQGAYCIKEYDCEKEDCIVLAEGHDFECEHTSIDEQYLNCNITYMYVVNGALNIEVQ